MSGELPRLAFASDVEWEAWLERNHEQAPGVWIEIAKKDSGIDSVRYPEVLDTALCFGWIDRHRERLDEPRFLRWQAAYTGQRSAGVPEDLQRELDARPRAAEFFARLSSQNRYSILYRLDQAKRAETRARRLQQFVAMLEAGQTLHPQ